MNNCNSSGITEEHRKRFFSMLVIEKKAKEKVLTSILQNVSIINRES